MLTAPEMKKPRPRDTEGGASQGGAPKEGRP